MKRLLFILIAFFLTSCTTNPSQTTSGERMDNNQNAQIKIAEAATSVSDSLSQLAAIEKATTQNPNLPAPPNPASIDMAQHVSVDWTGPLEALLKQIAKASNYRLQVIGKRPAIPVIVSVVVNDQPLATVLRDASYQAIKQTNVLVYPSRRIIELRYRND